MKEVTNTMKTPEENNNTQVKRTTEPSLVTARPLKRWKGNEGTDKTDAEARDDEMERTIVETKPVLPVSVYFRCAFPFLFSIHSNFSSGGWVLHG